MKRYNRRHRPKKSVKCKPDNERKVELPVFPRQHNLSFEKQIEILILRAHMLNFRLLRTF